MSASSRKQLIELAQQVHDACLPSAEVDRTLARLLMDIPAAIGELGWLSAHQYGVDLEVHDHRESLLALCSEAAVVFGAALLNLSVHTHNHSALESLSERLLSLRSLLCEQSEGLKTIEAELSLRLSDPDIALIEINKRRQRLLQAPQHSSAELIDAVRSLEQLQAETQRAERDHLEQERLSDALRARLKQAREGTAQLRREETMLSEELNRDQNEESRLHAQVQSLTSELQVVSGRLESLKRELTQLQDDPRSKIRASIASALAALPDDEVERP